MHLEECFKKNHYTHGVDGNSHDYISVNVWPHVEIHIHISKSFFFCLIELDFKIVWIECGKCHICQNQCRGVFGPKKFKILVFSSPTGYMLWSFGLRHVLWIPLKTVCEFRGSFCTATASPSSGHHSTVQRPAAQVIMEMSRLCNLEDKGLCHGPAHTSHLWHHPSSSLVVIVWRAVGKYLIFSIFFNNSTDGSLVWLGHELSCPGQTGL